MQNHTPPHDLFAVRFNPQPPPAPQWQGPSPDKVVFIRARVGGSDGPIKNFKGRFAWTLAQLIDAGRRGITSFERPAPRWSHYVYRLRREGLLIDMEEEKHGGDYRGWHGRYRLHTPLEILEVREAANG